MDFHLSPELAELQATVRRIARERVAPRAREIDDDDEYPDDVYKVFVDAGLTGLCIPEDLGGSGAGIFGLTIAIEEVAKYSNAAALMLLLTRLPTGPVLIAGLRGTAAPVRHARRRSVSSGPDSGSRSRRPAATSWACARAPSPTATTG